MVVTVEKRYKQSRIEWRLKTSEYGSKITGAVGYEW
jgi:hypothetical protein